MAFQKGQGGRPKGVKNKATRAREELVKAAVGAALAPVVAPEAVAAVIAAPAPVPAAGEPAPTERPEWAERAGIDSKAALLNIMRMAWDAFVAAEAKLEPMRATRDKLVEQLAASVGNKAAVESLGASIEALDKQVEALQDRADKMLRRCSEHAGMVIPYEYARLQANTNKQIGDIIVSIQDLGVKKLPGAWKKSKSATSAKA